MVFFTLTLNVGLKIKYSLGMSMTKVELMLVKVEACYSNLKYSRFDLKMHTSHDINSVRS